MENYRRILITGSAGLLGEALLKQFASHFEVIATYHKTPPIETYPIHEKVQADLADPLECRSLIETVAPDMILNSAAWVDVDGCETDRERARRSNFELLRNLVDSIGEKKPLIVQVSTDYIFSGREHPGRVDDPPEPLNYYGETKLLAEEYLRENYTNYLIARTCALFATPREGKTNLINYFYDNLMAGKSVSAPDDQFANPILIDNLAELVLEATQKEMIGIAHLGGPDYVSRFDFACIFAEVFGYDPELIIPVSAEIQKRPAQRPRFAGLDISETVSRFETPLMPLKQALAQVKSELAK